ncbi:MAG: hypothetical protein PHH91_03125 [Desulfuromonadaceae bacterium]|nr:hypothetical protein [Desulfuromonadaceae bacterium]
MITADKTVLELVDLYPETELVFEHYTRMVGVCICCEALFCRLSEISDRYEIDLDELLARLNSVT